MADILTSPAKYGDTLNTLLLKIAQEYWTALAGNTAGLQPPAYGDTRNTLLLKIDQYLERL